MNKRMMIYAGPFAMDLVFSTYYLAAPLLLIDLGANPIELGLLATIAMSMHMALANFMGPLSDRLGRRRLIITAPLLFVVSCLVMTVTQEVKVILILSVLNGLSLSMYWPSFQAWVADFQTGSGLARNIGTYNMSWTAATLAGPTLSGILYGIQPRLPFLVSALIALILVFLATTSVQDKKTPPREKEATVEVVSSIWQRRFLIAVWVANFAAWFVLGNARYQFPKLARELNLSPQIVGLLVGSVGFSQFVGFFLLQQTDRWHFKKSYLLGAQLLAVAGCLLIFVSQVHFLFGLALIMIGLSCSVTYYSSLYYAVHLFKKKGRGTGIHESILGSGALSGPILGGIAAHYVGLRTPYLLCLGVLLLALTVELILTKKSWRSVPS